MVLKGIAKVDIGPCDVGLYGKLMVLFDGAEVEVRGTMNSSGGKFRIRFEDNGVNPLFSLSVCIVSPFELTVQGFDVHVFSSGDDPIACLNKAMAFLTVVASSRFPSTNNQLRTSSNLRNQATIQDVRVTVQ
ncbi:hypothetical protein Tco_0991096 [Tanacetum coccineum]|uniref:Uncharacterized protein n=1 Tax=Tanacetum coccineum TaxID=301880 RepID=A0ABQ5EYN9_9ASTR